MRTGNRWVKGKETLNIFNILNKLKLQNFGFNGFKSQKPKIHLSQGNN